MASIRIPSSATALLSFCAKHQEANEHYCFDTFAHLITTGAAMGYHLSGAQTPMPCRSFLAQPYPIDLAIFRSLGLLPQLLAVGMSTLGNPDDAIDENKLAKLIEDLSNEGLRVMESILAQKGDTEFSWELSYWIANPPKVEHDQI
jgi:hypothetical protein